MPALDDRRDQAVDWLYGRINYESHDPIPYSQRGMKLDRIRELALRLGDPQQRFPIVHVAGTKGKGSTCAIIAAALQAAGQVVGVYSSPHFDRLEERFAVDGEPCSASELVDLVDRVRPVVEAMDQTGGGPTFFDLTTAIALLHFADRSVDTAVIEVGLGGRLDSTNIVTPVVSVITSISLDHTKQLGETLGEIAAEKAGIIKPGVPVVSGVAVEEPAAVIASIAEAQDAPLLAIGRDFSFERENTAWRFRRIAAEGSQDTISGVCPALPGDQHAGNVAVALATLGVLADRDSSITVEARKHGVAVGRLPGRMECFPGEPQIIIDGAHNDASAEALADALDELGAAPRERRVLVVAIAADKDKQAVLRPLVEQVGSMITTRFIDNPRAVPPEELAACVRGVASGSQEVFAAADPAAALTAASELTPRDGTIVFAGSLLFAAEVRRLIVAERGTPPR